MNKELLAELAVVQGLVLPVEVRRFKYRTGAYAGRYTGFVNGTHRIGLSVDEDQVYARLVLGHELGHALQVERLGSHEAFVEAYFEQVAEAGITISGLRSGHFDNEAYNAMPFEAEATAIAMDHLRGPNPIEDA